MKFPKTKDIYSIATFDDFATEYERLMAESIKFSGDNPDYFDRYKVDCLNKWIGKTESSTSVLDFGCGIGKISAITAKNFPKWKVHGFDVSSKSIEIARKKWGYLENLVFLKALPETAKFDIITAANVFHHINPEKRSNWVLRLKNHLTPSGKIVIFEHNPFNPFTRYVVNTLPFDEGVELITLSQFTNLVKDCGLRVQLKRYIVFFPKFLGFLRRFEPLLGFLPMGAQYMIVIGM
jgi:SAM-dependent methyltransferase